MLATSERQKFWLLRRSKSSIRDALLLDPGVIAEIEDTFAIDVTQLHHMVVHNALHVTGENLACIHFVESVRITARNERFAFAAYSAALSVATVITTSSGP